MTAFTHPAAVVAWLRARGVQGLTTDSRTLNATDAFIAWPGVATDPRRFVSAALKQGALACVVDQDGADAFGFDAEKVAHTPT